MFMLPKAIYRCNAILIKIPKMYFTDLEQMIQKSVWNQKTLNNHYNWFPSNNEVDT